MWNPTALSELASRSNVMDNNENYIKPRMIPDNVTDSGKILNGLVRTRNLIEGMIIAAPIVWIVLKFFHFNDPVYKVLALILAAGIPIFISLVLPTYSPFELLLIVLHYQRTKHYAKYNSRLKWEKMPDYLIQNSRLDPIEAIRDLIERMLKERSSNEAIINENITNPTHDERFIEDRAYLEDRDLVPDELKSSAQLKAEKRERRKREKEIREEQNRQIKEARRREREEKKSSRKKEFLTEKGEENGV